MPSPVIYFGARPDGNQRVSEELSKVGIQLVRMAPSSMKIYALPGIQPAMYKVYSRFLPLFMHSGINSVRVTTAQSPFVGLTHVDPSPIPHYANVIFHLPGRSVAPEIIQQLRTDINAKELRAKGKECFVIPQQDLLRLAPILAHNPVLTTPTIDNHLNIAGAKATRFLLRLADAFLRTHQYPLYWTKAGYVAGSITDMEMGLDSFPHAGTTTPGGSTAMASPDTLKHIFTTVNLPTTPATCNYVMTVANLPTNLEGLYFPFSLHLAREDQLTIPHVVRDKFFGCLGSDEEDADIFYGELCSDWGTVRNSDIGHMLSHLFKIIDMAVESGALVTLRVEDSVYKGAFLLGGGFSVRDHDGNLVDPVNHTELRTAIERSDPAVRAFNELKTVLATAGMPANEPVQGYRRLRTILDGLNTTEAVREKVLELAPRAALPEPYLAPTSGDVIRVLKAISDPTITEADFPLHPSMLFETVRWKRLLSAFGGHSISFRVPGGRKMSLEDTFSSMVRGRSGEKETKDVTKLALVVVPLSTAIEDWTSTLRDRAILNPYGNERTRASTSLIVKTMEKQDCLDIVGELRRCCGVTVAARGKKRGADEDGGAAAKRPRGYDDD